MEANIRSGLYDGILNYVERSHLDPYTLIRLSFCGSGKWTELEEYLVKFEDFIRKGNKLEVSEKLSEDVILERVRYIIHLNFNNMLLKVGC